MGKRVIWSEKASQDLINILEYWRERTGSTKYSLKLYDKVKDILVVISKFPDIGPYIENQPERYFIVDHYLIVYAENDTHISVLKIWDTRRHPDKFPPNWK
jgi:toxin YoeB